jgi:hypothetical protein
VPTGMVTAALIAFAVARLALLQFSLSALFVTTNCRNQPANADIIQWELPYGVPRALRGKPSVTAFREQIYRSRQSDGAPLPRTLIRFTERWLGRLSSNRRSSNRREVPLLLGQRSIVGHARVRRQVGPQSFGRFCPDPIAMLYNN